MKPMITIVDTFNNAEERQNAINVLERSCQKIDGRYYEYSDGSWRRVTVGCTNFTVEQWDEKAALETIAHQQTDIW